MQSLGNKHHYLMTEQQSHHQMMQNEDTLASSQQYQDGTSVDNLTSNPSAVTLGQQPVNLKGRHVSVQEIDKIANFVYKTTETP